MAHKAYKMDPMPKLDNVELAEHLGGMLRFKTICNLDTSLVDWSQYDAMHAYLEKTYPLLHQHLEKTVINGYSLLYHWKGTGESGLNPVLLMAHQDVVPVTPGTEQDWEHDGFSGEVADGYLWGRGAMDIKVLIMGEMEAVEKLLEAGFTPDRDVYLAYGHDEEIMGQQGAQKIADYLQQQGVHLDFVVDEGGAFARGENYGAPGTLVANIGIFEKGYCDLMFTVEDQGGHSSRPGESTALGELARAIDAVERAKFPLHMSKPIRLFYEAIGEHLEDQTIKELALDLENRADELCELLAKTPAGNAMVRTTTAATQAWASPAPNILPQKAQAVFNFRLNDTETVDSVIAHCEKAIDNPRVKISVVKGQNPSHISNTEGLSFELLKKTIWQLQPEAVIVPNAVLGGTDSRKFDPICDGVFRFGPFIGGIDLRHTVHATNERTKVDALDQGVMFYIQLLKNLCTEQGRVY